MMKKVLAAFLVSLMFLGQTTFGSQIATSNSEISGEITISCYDSSVYQKLLEAAAKGFEEKYPGTKVNISEFSIVPDIRTVMSEDGKAGMTMIR